MKRCIVQHGTVLMMFKLSTVSFFRPKKNNNDYHKCCRIKLKLTEEYFTHRRLSHSAKKNACT